MKPKFALIAITRFKCVIMVLIGGVRMNMENKQFVHWVLFILQTILMGITTIIALRLTTIVSILVLIIAVI